MLEVAVWPAPILKKKMDPVVVFDKELEFLAEQMFETMYSLRGIGLAAPQVGINQRIFVMDVGEGPLAIINPKITKKMGNDVLEEGCLSIPEVTINIARPQQITVKYMDENGKTMEITCEDLTARVIQHETDHLNGKLVIDYASSDEKAQFKDQLKALEKSHSVQDGNVQNGNSDEK